MKDKLRKKVVESLLLIVCLVLAVPIGKVLAAPEKLSIPFVQVGESNVLKFGSYSCLAFTLPESGKIKAEIYYSNGIRMGTLYGISYYGCVNYIGYDTYEWKEGSKEELLKGLEGLEIRPIYEKLYGFQGIAELESGLPFGMYSNYLIWKGQYIPNEEQYPRYVQPGKYVIQISPLKPSVDLEPVCLEVMIKGSGKDGALTKEDVELMRERELTDFPHEPIHIADMFSDTEKGYVDMRDKALWWRHTDLTAEEDDELEFKRIYHSLSIIWNDFDSAGLGMGWTHNYSYSARIFRRDIIIRMEGDRELSFSKNYTGEWVANWEHTPYTLTMGENCFWLHEPDGRIVTFDMEGRAIQIETRDGKIIRLEYEEKLLSKVSEGEKCLSFTYVGERLYKVTDQKGRSVSFDYEGETRKNLVEVHNGDGGTLCYTYDEKHDLLTAVDARGEVELEASYEPCMDVGSNSQVASFWMQGSPKKLYTYEGDWEMNTVTEKEEGGGTRVLVYKVGYQYEENAWSLFDEDGELVRETDFAGRTTVYD